MWRKAGMKLITMSAFSTRGPRELWGLNEKGYLVFHVHRHWSAADFFLGYCFGIF
jgi:hypothetical protein